MRDIAIRRNLYFSGNGICTDQLVSIASFRADLSEVPAAPLPLAAPISLIGEDQPRPLTGQPVKAEMQKLKREIESLKKQLQERQGATPNGQRQPINLSILRFFSSGSKTATETPAIQQQQRDVGGDRSAPALRTDEAVEGLAALRNLNIGDRYVLGKRQRSPSGYTSTHAHEKGDEEGDDDDDVIDIDGSDDDAVLDDDDNSFGEKKKKTNKGTSSKGKSDMSTFSNSKSKKKKK